MTDQRNRVITDPGLGPVEVEHPSTLRSIAADRINDEDPAARVYYEPKLLNAVSDHKTLELETVKLAKDIDPRKLPTELRLRRPVLHVMPASDPNWPAPSSQHDVGWPPPQYDSGWPPPETVLTTSQPPLAPRRRAFIPLAVLALLGVTLLVVLGANTPHRSTVATITAQGPQLATRTVAASPNNGEGPAGIRPALASGESVLASSESALSPESAAKAVASAMAAASAEASVGSAAASTEAALASTEAAEPTALAAPTRLADSPHHATSKLTPPSSSSPALSASPTVKPKRAIY